MGNDGRVSRSQTPKEVLDIYQSFPICPTQNLKQALGFATALIECLANILNPKLDGFPLLTFTSLQMCHTARKVDLEIQFVADLLNINSIVTFTINPPLLNEKSVRCHI